METNNEMKKAYPELGDNTEQGTIFPINLPIVDKEYIKRLKEENPNMFRYMMGQRARILSLTGAKTLSELNGCSDDQDLVDYTRDRMLDSLNVLGENKNPEERREQAELYSQIVDGFVTDVINRFFPGHELTLGLSNEVSACNDPAELLLIALDETWDDKIRFEAKRKLILIELIAKVEHALKSEKKDMHRLNKLLAEHIYYQDPGTKRGSLDVKTLVTTHDLQQKNLCTKVKLLDERPEHVSVDQKAMDLSFRKFQVDDPASEGGKRTIPFVIDERKKSEFSRVLKMLRKDTTSVKDVIKDLNGVRLIFESQGDIHTFQETIIGRLQGAGHNVRMPADRMKETIGIDEDSKLGVTKFNLEIDDMNIEFQSLTFEQFANYSYRRPTSWPEYEVRRFFEASVSESLFPDVHYSGLDREEISKEAQDRAYRDHWERAA